MVKSHSNTPPRLHIILSGVEYHIDIENTCKFDLERVPPGSYFTFLSHKTAFQIAEETAQTGHAYVRPWVDLDEWKNENGHTFNSVGEATEAFLELTNRYYRVDNSMFKACQASATLRHITPEGGTAATSLAYVASLPSSPLHLFLRQSYPLAYSAYRALGLNPMSCLLTQVAMLHPFAWTCYGVPLSCEMINRSIVDPVEESLQAYISDNLPDPFLVIQNHDDFNSLSEVSELTNNLSISTVAFMLATDAWSGQKKGPWKNLYTLLAKEPDSQSSIINVTINVMHLIGSIWLATDYPEEYLCDPRSFLPDSIRNDSIELLNEAIGIDNAFCELSKDSKKIFSFPFQDFSLSEENEMIVFGGWKIDPNMRTPFVPATYACEDYGSIRGSDIDQMLFGFRNEVNKTLVKENDIFVDPFSELKMDMPSYKEDEDEDEDEDEKDDEGFIE